MPVLSLCDPNRNLPYVRPFPIVMLYVVWYVFQLITLKVFEPLPESTLGITYLKTEYRTLKVGHLVCLCGIKS